jgi:type IX secretion system substrate protein
MKKYILIILIIYSTFYISQCFSQSITWQRAYFDPPIYHSVGMDVCEADSDNFYIAGYTAGNYPIYNLLYLIKINKYGDTLWTRKVNPPGNESSIMAFAVASSGDGGGVVTGLANQTPAFTLKFDLNGNLQWFNSYGGYPSACYDIIKTSHGGYIACGRSNSNDGYILRIDSLGNLLWQVSQTNMGVRTYNSVINGIDGGYVLAGVYQVNGSDPANSLIVKIDSLGNLVWEKIYQFGYSSVLKSICKANGRYYSSGENAEDSVFLIKTDIMGNVIDTTIFHSDYGENESILINYSLNRFVFTSLKLDSALIRIIDTTGYIYREKTYTWTRWIIPHSTLHIQNSDLLLVGSCADNPPFNNGVYALRTDSTLNVPPPIGIDPIITHTSSNFNLKQNYPNPFNPVTEIKYSIPVNTMVKINVYNLLGQNVVSLVNEYKNAGEYSVIFDGTNYSSGIYFYTIEAGNYKDSKKMVLIK